jgi:hypothetical protein
MRSYNLLRYLSSCMTMMRMMLMIIILSVPTIR